MTVFERLHIPSLGGASAWLNSELLGPAELRGHVVLVNFWTLTCINWLRQEPYIRAWSRAYRYDGLVVIGVHTPEFSFEHEIDRVREATSERAIDYSGQRPLSQPSTGRGHKTDTSETTRATPRDAWADAGSPDLQEKLCRE
jgi:thiol-disulfide isomerase/thioredoxin